MKLFFGAISQATPLTPAKNNEQNLLLEVVRVRVRQRGRLDALLREARLDLRDVDLRAVIDRCVFSLFLSRRWRIDSSAPLFTSSPTAISGQIRSARGMPFFLATASPSFSALTTSCGLAGALGVTNAAVLESSSSERNWQRMVDPSE